MATDVLKLDIFVDDHGAVQTLKNVDDGVKKVTTSAKQQGDGFDDLRQQMAALRGRADDLDVSQARVGMGLSRMTLLSGVAVGAFTLLAASLRQSVDEADKLTAAADQLQAPATRIQQITLAASESKVGFDTMVGGLNRLQERIGRGGLNADLQALGINLQAFRKADIVEQFLQIADGISQIEDPAERAAMRVKILGGNSEEMGRLMKASFRETTDSAIAMSAATIEALDGMGDAVERTIARVTARGKVLLAESFVGLLNLMGKDDWHQAGLGNPSVSAPTHQPNGLPAVNPPGAVGIENMESNIRAQIEATIELRNSWAATIEMVRIYGTDMPAAITIVDERLKQIAEGQALITKAGREWADVLNTRVAASVDAITAKLANAIQMNTMLSGSAGGRRDSLMGQLTQTSNPFESEFDKRFNQIDANYKRLMAMVDQTDRATASVAENNLLEAMNLEVMQLQQGGGKAAQVTNHTTIDARGALFPDAGSLDSFVRMIEQMMADREYARGGRASR